MFPASASTHYQHPRKKRSGASGLGGDGSTFYKYLGERFLCERATSKIDRFPRLGPDLFRDVVVSKSHAATDPKLTHKLSVQANRCAGVFATFDDFRA